MCHAATWMKILNSGVLAPFPRNVFILIKHFHFKLTALASENLLCAGA
jgi:hypothetical protein